MKTRLLSLLLVCFTIPGFAQSIVHFKLSKPYCLLNFLETCAGEQGTSSTLKNYAERHGLLEDTAFISLMAAYKKLNIEYTYPRDQYPEHRIRSRYGNTRELITLKAVQSDDLKQFKDKTIGIIPNSDHQDLFKVLTKAEPFYDDLIWKPNLNIMNKKLVALQDYQRSIDTLFNLLNHFYRSSWSSDIPFIVTIYPVPGVRGNTTAKPYANSLCVGVLTDRADYDGVAGVVLHEMCHELYNEQPAAVQQQIEQLFMQDAYKYRPFAYDYFDEGLATACGNGWAQEVFSGKLDKKRWYDDDYIDGYGHALYPLVKEYLDQNKSIDSEFIYKAITSFAALFPKAPYQYNLLLNSICLYSDADTKQERDDINDALYKNFRVASRNSSSPILDPASLGMLTDNSGTQVIVVNKNFDTNLKKLKELFPPLDAALKDKANENFLASFYDAKGRAVVIIRAATIKDIESAFHKLDKDAYLDPNQVYYKLD